MVQRSNVSFAHGTVRYGIFIASIRRHSRELNDLLRATDPEQFAKPTAGPVQHRERLPKPFGDGAIETV
jgi:hypothetical protein